MTNAKADVLVRPLVWDARRFLAEFLLASQGGEGGAHGRRMHALEEGFQPQQAERTDEGEQRPGEHE